MARTILLEMAMFLFGLSMVLEGVAGIINHFTQGIG
jgi:hypothetical protein